MWEVSVAPKSGRKSSSGRSGKPRPAKKSRKSSVRTTSSSRANSSRSKSPRQAEGKQRSDGAQRSAGRQGNEGTKPKSGASRQRSEGKGKSSQKPRGLGGDQVEGRQAVRELLLAGRRRVREVLVAEEVSGGEVIADIEALSQELGVPCRQVPKRQLQASALTESHQGVVAKADEVEALPLDTLASDPSAFILVMDGVTDPGNLGAILRSAECSGVSGVVLGRHRSVRVSPTVTKTAAGAVEHVPMALVGGIPTAIETLKEHGVVTIGLDGGASHSFFDLEMATNGPVALVLGAEGRGLSRLVRQRVDMLASIPMRGNLNSLNVATASAVACFEVLRNRQRFDPPER